MMLATLLAAPLLATPQLPTPDAGGWPHLRGPALDGSAPSDARLESGSIGLRPAWKRALGSAYSGLAIAGNRLVTMFSDGEVDALIAVDTKDGSTLWRHDLGPVYLGHDGSTDGPISSPVIGRGAVYAIDARGNLVAVSLSSGEVQWTVALVADLGSKAPEYGFTTTPILAGDVLIVQAGGSDGRSLCGLDAATGTVRWTVGESGAEYQSPVVMELAGRRQVVVLNGAEIASVAPEDGTLLWRHALARGEASSGFASPIDGERFIASVSGSIAAFRVVLEGTEYAVEQLYASRELGRSYAMPVHHDGHLYGYKGDFLTCVDATSGRRVWKSRPPGGRGLILVDGHLVVFGAEGVVALVEATPDEYREVARVKALEHTGYTWPSFAAGHIFVRNADELACIEITDRPVAIASSDTNVAAGGGDFARFVAEVLEAPPADERSALIDAFLSQQASFPLIEGELVHLVFRGEVEDVAVVGSMVASGQADPMERIEGTDLYVATYSIEPGARWEYQFQVDFEGLHVDPLNPRTSPAGRGNALVSEVVTPGYEVATHFEESDGPRGRLEAFEYESEMLSNKRSVQIYLPPGYDEGSDAYPLLIVHRGKDWLDRGRLNHSLDNLIGKSVRPLVVAFVDPIGEWWYEAGGTGTEEYIAMLATEFVPFLETRYRLSSGPEDRALMGALGFGLTAAYGVLLHNDVFGKAAVQSVALGDRARHAFFELLASEPDLQASFYVDWNRYGERNPDDGYDYGAESRRVAEALREAGFEVTGGEALDGHGWGSWRSRSDAWLEALFPLE